MSNLIEHAKEEFKIMGYKPLEEKQEEDPNKWIQENVLELLEVFSKQGHSGSSAPFCIKYFEALANFKPLSPIKCDDSEWVEVGGGMFQNKRLSSVFKEGAEGKPSYLDAIIFKTEKGTAYSGHAIIRAEGKKCNGVTIKSRQFIRLPFYPKTFYVKVNEVEVSKDNWEFYLDDLEQLEFELAQKYYAMNLF